MRPNENTIILIVFVLNFIFGCQPADNKQKQSPLDEQVRVSVDPGYLNDLHIAKGQIVYEPVIEAVMIGIAGSHSFSWRSSGRVITQRH